MRLLLAGLGTESELRRGARVAVQCYIIGKHTVLYIHTIDMTAYLNLASPSSSSSAAWGTSRSMSALTPSASGAGLRL